jgi:hypothetical protein
MRRCVFGLLLPLVLGCAGKNTVAGEDQTKAEQLASGLPSWCTSTCARLADCASGNSCDCSGDLCDCSTADTSCPTECQKAFAGFTSGGDACAEVGQRYKSCVDHATCDTLEAVKGCLPTKAEQTMCPGPDDSDTVDNPPVSGGSVGGPIDTPPSSGGTSSAGNSSGDPATAGTTSTPSGALVSCRSGSGGGMAAGGPETSGIICEESRQDCTDGHNYGWICSRNSQGQEACSCLFDSSVTGGFAPGPSCPDTTTVNAGCHWNLSD